MRTEGVAPWVRWLPAPVAILVAVGGWVVLDSVLQGHAGHVHGGTYEAAGLSLSVDRMLWMSNDMTGQGPLASNSQGFQMDPSMMPGMQTSNNNRLRVEVTLRNLTSQIKSYAPGDFHAVSPEGRRWSAVDDGGAANQSGGKLGPGYEATFDVYFDIPVTQKNVSVEWSKDGYTVNIPYGGGQAGPHKHA